MADVVVCLSRAWTRFKARFLTVLFHTFLQVDHFSFLNNASFMQRYLINTDYWKPGAPIFFYTGNEGDIVSFCENTVSAKQVLIVTHTHTHTHTHMLVNAMHTTILWDAMSKSMCFNGGSISYVNRRANNNPALSQSSRWWKKLIEGALSAFVCPHDVRSSQIFYLSLNLNWNRNKSNVLLYYCYYYPHTVVQSFDWNLNLKKILPPWTACWHVNSLQATSIGLLDVPLTRF